MRTLKALGWQVFLAHEDVRVSDVWRDEILKHLESCSALMVIVTPHAAQSTWVNQEIGIAMGKGKPIAPLIFGRHRNLVSLSFLEMLQAEYASRRAITKKVVEKALQAINLQKRAQTTRRALTKTAANYGIIARWRVYATLHAICERVLHEAPRPAEMVALTYEKGTIDKLSDEERRQLWNKGKALPSIRLSEAQLKEIVDIMMRRGYHIEDSTATSWQNVLHKPVYGLGPVQHDLELQSFNSFCKEVDEHYERLKKKTRRLGVLE